MKNKIETVESFPVSFLKELCTKRGALILFSSLLFVVATIPDSKALETTFNNPTFGDLNGITAGTCINSDSIGFDEGDVGLIGESFAPFHFCVNQGYTSASSYLFDSSIDDPDICETNTNISNFASWQYDTTGTNNYTSIVCFLEDESVGCTQPNALNYNPSASMDDGSCFYTDPTNTGGLTSVNVEVNPVIEGGFGEDIFEVDFLTEYYYFVNGLMILLTIMLFIFATFKNFKKIKLGKK